MRGQHLRSDMCAPSVSAQPPHPTSVEHLARKCWLTRNMSIDEGELPDELPFTPLDEERPDGDLGGGMELVLLGPHERLVAHGSDELPDELPLSDVERDDVDVEEEAYVVAQVPMPEARAAPRDDECSVFSLTSRGVGVGRGGRRRGRPVRSFALSPRVAPMGELDLTMAANVRPGQAPTMEHQEETPGAWWHRGVPASELLSLLERATDETAAKPCEAKL